MPPKPMRGENLAETSYPPYTIKMIGTKHFLVAGGGGSARTGVVNSLEIYELIKSGLHCSATKANHVDTDRIAIMNSCIQKTAERPIEYTVAAGEDDSCHFYVLRKKMIALRNTTAAPPRADVHHDGNTTVRHRKSNFTRSHEYDESEKTWAYDVQSVGKIQTDFHPAGAFQKAVVMSPEGNLAITAGCDGCIRGWEYPSLEKKFEIKAHEAEIDDIHISPQGDLLCSTSKDGHCYVWDVNTQAKLSELVLPVNDGVKYKTRACRFSPVPDLYDVYSLYTVHIPATRSAQYGNSYVAKWNLDTFSCVRMKSIGMEIVCSLSVSWDGMFLGTGTLNGSVAVFSTQSFQRRYYQPECHGIFVTGLEFTPNTADILYITGDHAFTLLSISADNKVKIHQEPALGSLSVTWYAVMLFLLVYFIFLILNFVGF